MFGGESLDGYAAGGDEESAVFVDYVPAEGGDVAAACGFGGVDAVGEGGCYGVVGCAGEVDVDAGLDEAA